MAAPGLGDPVSLSIGVSCSQKRRQVAGPDPSCGWSDVGSVSPGSRPAEGARITITGTEPNRTEITFYPRSCGAGCETITHDWMAGTTELAIPVADGRYRGGANVPLLFIPTPVGYSHDGRL